MPKIISLNIERSNHLHRNIPFLQKESPDVLCLQEAFEADLERIASDLAMPHFVWFRDTRIDATKSGNGKEGYSGPALFSRTVLSDVGNEYYHMPQSGIALEMEDPSTYRETNAHGIIWASTDIEGARYVVANMHFTWTDGGVMNEEQRSDFEKLKKILEKLPAHILAGDFNAPRGMGMWEKFVEYYGGDAIPLEHTSTLDPTLHRVKNLERVVDGIFAKSPYFVRDVRVVPGLSDHQAIVAHIGL